MLKKVLSLILICAVIVLAAACTPATTTSSTTAGTTKATTATTAATTTGTTAAEWAIPYTGDPVVFKAFAADVGVTEDKECPVYKIYKEAVGNIEVEWELVPFSDFDTKANIYFNSGEIPDIIWYRSPDLMNKYSSSGLFLDFNEYADYTPNWNISCEANPGQRTYETADGEQFIIHGWDNDYPGEGWFANKTVLDTMGIAIPETLEELTAALEKVKETDATVMPFHTFWKTSYYMSIFANLIDAYTGFRCDLETKVWNHSILDPDSNYKELITLLADFYEKGYFNAEFSTMSDEQTTQLIASNKWAFTFTYHGQVDVWYANDVTTEIVPLLPPAKSGVTPINNGTYVSDSPYWGYSANANIDKPELVSAFIDAMLSDTVADAFQWGVEGTSYTVNASGKKEWISSFLEDTEAPAKLGIWNILPPRYITKRDDASSISRGTQLSKDSFNLNVNAIINGTVYCPYYRLSPIFTDAESEELSIITTAVNTVIDENQALFILGQRDLSEWDTYIEEVKAAGDLTRALEIYNAAKQKPDRLQQEDRDYVTIE